MNSLNFDTETGNDEEFFGKMERSRTNLGKLFGLETTTPAHNENHQTLKYQRTKQPKQAVGEAAVAATASSKAKASLIKSGEMTTLTPLTAASAHTTGSNSSKISWCTQVAKVAKAFKAGDLIGRVGVALLTNNDKDCKIIVYKTRVNVLTTFTLKINSELDQLHKQNRYIQFYDDDSIYWCLLFEKAADDEEFLMKLNEFGIKVNIEVVKESAADAITAGNGSGSGGGSGFGAAGAVTKKSALSEKDKPSCDKASADSSDKLHTLLARLSKVGQQLPKLTPPPTSKSTKSSSQTYPTKTTATAGVASGGAIKRIPPRSPDDEEDNVVKEAKAAKENDKFDENDDEDDEDDDDDDDDEDCSDSSDTEQIKPMKSTSNKPKLLPHVSRTEARTQLMAHAPHNDFSSNSTFSSEINPLETQYLQMLLSENRTQNTELRINIGKLENKIEKVLDKFEMLQQLNAIGSAALARAGVGGGPAAAAAAASTVSTTGATNTGAFSKLPPHTANVNVHQMEQRLYELNRENHQLQKNLDEAISQSIQSENICKALDDIFYKHKKDFEMLGLVTTSPNNPEIDFGALIGELISKASFQKQHMELTKNEISNRLEKLKTTEDLLEEEKEEREKIELKNQHLSEANQRLENMLAERIIAYNEMEEKLREQLRLSEKQARDSADKSQAIVEQNDTLQKDIESQRQSAEDEKRERECQKQELECQKQELERQKQELERQKQELECQKQQLEQQKQELECQKQQLERQKQEIESKLESQLKELEKQKDKTVDNDDAKSDTFPPPPPPAVVSADIEISVKKIMNNFYENLTTKVLSIDDEKLQKNSIIALIGKSIREETLKAMKN